MKEQSAQRRLRRNTGDSGDSGDSDSWPFDHWSTEGLDIRRSSPGLQVPDHGRRHERRHGDMVRDLQKKSKKGPNGTVAVING